MPWNPAQHRLFEEAAHNPAVARRVGIPVATASRMASEGIKRARGGLSYADGGDVDMADLRSEAQDLRDAYGSNTPIYGASHNRTYASPSDDISIPALGGSAALAGALAKLTPRRVNRIARPIQRLLTSPVFSTEAVSQAPLSSTESALKFALAREHARENGFPEFANLPVTEGQGAFMSNMGNLELNPVYMQKLPRTRDVSKDTDALQYASEMGQTLGQEAVPVQRAMPNLIDTPEDANVLLAKGVGRGALQTLAKGLGPDTVVAQQPGSRAMLMPLAGEDIAALRGRASGLMPDLSMRYGVSDPNIDRILMGVDSGYSPSYSQYLNDPRSSRYDALERIIMGRNPSTEGLPLPEYQTPE